MKEAAARPVVCAAVGADEGAGAVVEEGGGLLEMGGGGLVVLRGAAFLG